MQSELKKFVDNHLYRIEGFLHPADAQGLVAIGRAQFEFDVQGSVMEIGVFWGRSFALLCQFLRREEFGVAADLFDIWAEEGAEGRQLATFRKTMRDLKFPEDQLIVLAGDSADIDPHDVVKRAGRMRLMSIDGGHEEHHVESDIAVGINVLGEGGVIIFDDFLNAQYPDVTVAVMKNLDGSLSDFEPFLITRNKLYVAERGWASRYSSFVAKGEFWAGVQLDRFRFRGSEVLFLNQTTPTRAVYEACAKRGLGGIGSLVVRGSSSRFQR